MHLIDRSKSQYGPGHVVYEKAEADAENLQYKYWKECEEGDWALSDDGFVAKILKKRVYKGVNFFVLPYTRNFAHKASRVEFLKCKDPSNIGGKSWQEREIARKRGRTVIQLMAKMKLAGKIDWTVLGQAYRPDDKIPIATVKRFLKQKQVQDMISREMDAELARAGVTDTFVLETLKKAMDTAVENEDVGNMLKGVAEAAKLRDMYPKDNRATATVEYSISKDLIERISSGTDSLPPAEEALRLDPEAAIDAIR